MDEKKGNLNERTRKRLYDTVYIAFFAALIAVCSWISIPSEVPFTLQTFAVCVSVGLLGGKRGTVAVLVYIFLGLVGVPVFAGFKGGVAALAGVTGGYIVGFIFTALVMWLFEKIFGKKIVSLTVSMILGLAVLYLFGSVWFMILYTKNTGSIGFTAVLLKCVVPYMIPEVIKVSLAVFLTAKLSKFVKK